MSDIAKRFSERMRRKALDTEQSELERGEPKFIGDFKAPREVWTIYRISEDGSRDPIGDITMPPGEWSDYAVVRHVKMHDSADSPMNQKYQDVELAAEKNPDGIEDRG